MIPVTDIITANNWEGIPLVQSGRGIVGYRGVSRYQRGNGFGSILRSVFKMARPLVTKVAKNVAKEGLETAALVGSDLLEGDNLETSIKNRGKQGASNLFKKAVKKIVPPQAKGYKKLKPNRKKKGLNKVKQSGGYIGYKRKRKTKKKSKKQIGSGKRKYKRTRKTKPKSSKKKSDFFGII